LLRQYVPTMTPGYAGRLVPRKTAIDRQTDMDGHIKCSLLTLEREEQAQERKN
jgi:hypothetical protein